MFSAMKTVLGWTPPVPPEHDASIARQSQGSGLDWLLIAPPCPTIFEYPQPQNHWKYIPPFEDLPEVPAPSEHPDQPADQLPANGTDVEKAPLHVDPGEQTASHLYVLRGGAWQRVRKEPYAIDVDGFFDMCEILDEMFQVANIAVNEWVLIGFERFNENHYLEAAAFNADYGWGSARSLMCCYIWQGRDIDQQQKVEKMHKDLRDTPWLREISSARSGIKCFMRLKLTGCRSWVRLFGPALVTVAVLYLLRTVLIPLIKLFC